MTHTTAVFEDALIKAKDEQSDTAKDGDAKDGDANDDDADTDDDAEG
jgi:hypothetical protein